MEGDGPCRSVANGSYPSPTSGVAAERNYPTTEVRGGGQERQAATMHEGREEIPLIQGKEQWLHFVVAAMKRYPTSNVREIRVRQ